MNMIPEIWSELCTLAQLEEEEAEQWYDLCRSCKEKLENQFRPEIHLVEHKALICRAAAGMAFYEMTLILAARGELGSFAAGDLKLSQDVPSRIRAAERVRDTRLDEIAPLLQDDRFVFRGVRGHG